MPISKASSSAVAPGAKGDLVVGTTTNDSGILGVGSTDQVLTVDSSTATGLKWAAASAGGMTLISTTTLSGSSVTLSSIPQTYNSLYLVLRNITGAVQDSEIRIYPNNVADLCSYYGFRNTITIANVSTFIRMGGSEQTLRTGGNNAWALSFDNYTSTASFKPFQWYGFHRTASNVDEVTQAGGAFRSNTAISSIVLTWVDNSSSFNGGTVLLYGVK